MKILFANRLFHNVSGGIERIAIAMMNEFCDRGHAVELLSWDFEESDTYYPLDPRVLWHRLGIGDAREKAGWRVRIKRQWAIRRLLVRQVPDVVVAFQDGAFLTVVMAALGLGIPIVAAERNAPDRFDHIKAGKHKNFVFQSFRLADRITVQWDDYITGYPGYLRNRIVSIPNPVAPATRQADPTGQGHTIKRLLAVGRLSYQKNQSVLIDAFARLSDAFPSWRLVLVGTGEDEPRLRQLAEGLGLRGRVEFTGAAKDVENHYVNSQLFCMPSRWEGFPNALAEAMAHGLPAVGFAGCAGVRQLIMDGKTGQLAPGNGSAEALAKTLGVLMADDMKRQEMGRSARVAMAHYAPKIVFDQWENLFRDLACPS